MIFFRSQRHQLTAIIFGLITLLVSMLLWGVLTVSQSGQEQRLQAREEVLLAFVATICRGGLLTNEYADSQLLAEDLLGDPQIEKIMLADYRGRILISTSSVDIGEPFQREKLTEPTWRFQIIDNPTGTLGTLAILFSRVALEDAARELRQTSLLLALPLLLVVAGISWLLGSLLSRRLEMLTAAMRQVADGKLETRVAESGRDEIARLGSMLNTMTENLQNTFQKLTREISERRQVEERLQNERQFLQAIFDTMEEGIVACDANGILTRFNQATRRFHGLPEEALPAEQWAEYYDLYLPDGKTTLSKEEVPLYRALSGEKVTDAELMIIPKEGQLRTLIANGQPLHDSGGKIVGAVVTMHDISGVKLATEELRHSHDLMRYIIEHTRSAIAVHDRDLKYIYVSQSYLDDYKLKEQDIIGKHHYDVFPDLPQKWRDVHKKALAGEVSSAEADPYEREDGSVEWTRWECRPWYEADGAVGGIIVYTEVITEHKKAEDELKQYRDHLEELILERTLDVEETQNALLNLLDDMNIAKEQLEAANERLQGLDRMKSMFVASMSHELRTPLNSIIGFSSILLEGWDGEINEVQEDNIRRILRSGKHLLSLINDVIDVSKIEAGTIAFNLEEFDFQEVCREAESMVQAEIEGKGLDFRMEVEQVSMRTDRRRLFQVVLNLLTNAIKFTGKGAVRLKGRVTDREHIAEELAHHFPAGVQGQFLEVTVEDSGIGIEQQDFVKLFKPFSRLHDSGRSRYPGTGLGLYLTQKLVQEILQGAITFTSISGKGSTFMFAIPCRLTENEN